MNPENDPRYRDHRGSYHHTLMARKGVTPDTARAIMRTNTTATRCHCRVHRGDADSLICGTFGQYLWHLNYVTRGPGTATVCPPMARCR